MQLGKCCIQSSNQLEGGIFHPFWRVIIFFSSPIILLTPDTEKTKTKTEAVDTKSPHWLLKGHSKECYLNPEEEFGRLGQLRNYIVQS